MAEFSHVAKFAKVCAPPPVKNAPAPRIAPLQRRFEHRLQAAVLRPREIRGGPAAQRVVAEAAIRNSRATAATELVVQLGNDFQIADQGAQLRGRAELQFRSRVDVERTVQAVRVYPHMVAVVVAALVQHEAPGDLRRVGAVQQTVAVHPALRRNAGSDSRSMTLATRACVSVSTAVSTVRSSRSAHTDPEVQQTDQPVADLLGRFALHIGYRGGGRRRLGTEIQLGLERGVAQ